MAAESPLSMASTTRRAVAGPEEMPQGPGPATGCRVARGLVHALQAQLLHDVARRRGELQLGGRSPGRNDRLPASGRVQEIWAPRAGGDEHLVRAAWANAFQDDARRSTVLY